jgi:hypothetical protein
MVFEITFRRMFIRSLLLVLLSLAYCVASEVADKIGPPSNNLYLRKAVDKNSTDGKPEEGDVPQQVVSADCHLQHIFSNSSQEPNKQTIPQLRLRTMLTTSFSCVLWPSKMMLLFGASTLFHATLFRGLFPPLVKALKSSELGDIDLSPDAISRNTADFIMDYVCEVPSRPTAF